MVILGLNMFHPDASAALVVDGKLVAAVEEERFCRVKHWAGFPAASIEYCLKEGGVALRDVDYIVFNRDPWANFCRKVGYVVCHQPPFALLKNRFQNLCKVGGVRQELLRSFPEEARGLRAKFLAVEHHRAHLSSAFFVSGYEESAVVSIDGFGDFTSCMVAKGSGTRMRVLSQVCYPHSLGLMYTALTQFLGFKKFGDEYKVMGLAAYGQPRYADRMRTLVRLLPDGTFALNLQYFTFHRKTQAMLWNNTEPVLEDLYSPKLEELFGPERAKDAEPGQHHCDLAASLQAVYEEAFFHVLEYASRATGSRRLCLAGGCALNSVANGKIFSRSSFTDVYVQPGSSDAGGALGAAYYLYHQLLGRKRSFVMEDSYWGPHFSGAQVRECIGQFQRQLEGCSVEELPDERELCARAAKLIADGNVVGWFQGRMEWGARALGNRSILADPRRPQMKDVLNSRIKRREPFRPFAPAILVEKVGEYFEIDYPDPFMVKVYPVRREQRERIPAVTHVDGTGRLQTVSRRENPRFWTLISEFEGLTGIPVVLNTSFNENEPIVCTPREAMECFVRTRMDVLVVGNYVICKQGRDV